ncbi:hypothetical protein PL81_01780 [Streptomyces sp. RSD-27]|nr:hypothetical protein PL81_01780 [Streptomyces sp. RSD-27]
MAGEPFGQAAQVQGVAQVQEVRFGAAEAGQEVLGGPPGGGGGGRVQEDLFGEVQGGAPAGGGLRRDLAAGGEPSPS